SRLMLANLAFQFLCDQVDRSVHIVAAFFRPEQNTRKRDCDLDIVQPSHNAQGNIDIRSRWCVEVSFQAADFLLSILLQCCGDLHTFATNVKIHIDQPPLHSFILAYFRGFYKRSVCDKTPSTPIWIESVSQVNFLFD